MFNSQFAGEISWLLPAALLLLVIARVHRRAVAVIAAAGYALALGDFAGTTSQEVSPKRSDKASARSMQRAMG